MILAPQNKNSQIIIEKDVKPVVNNDAIDKQTPIKDPTNIKYIEFKVPYPPIFCTNTPPHITPNGAEVRLYKTNKKSAKSSEIPITSVK
jgi:hypothetical protein